MVSPTVLATLVLGAYPLVFIVLTALSESSLGQPFQDWVGTRNLQHALGDGDVVASLVRNVVYAILVTIASTALGVVGALALHTATRRGSIARTLMLLPLITPPVVVGVLWKLIFNPAGGLLDTLLVALGYRGEPVAVLSSSAWAIVGVGVADVWEWTPIVLLLVFAALLGQDRAIGEAAALDGAHGFRLFREITFPAIGGTVAAVFLIRLVLAFKVFDLVFVLTSGGPGQATTMPAYLIYQAALQQFDIGRASSITLLLAVVVTIVTLPVILVTRRLHRD